MKKLILFVCVLFAITSLSIDAKSQQGVAMLKITKHEDGGVEVQPIQDSKLQNSQKTITNELISQADTEALEQINKKSVVEKQTLNPGPDLDVVMSQTNMGYNSSTHILSVAVRVINSGTTNADWSYLGYYVSENAGWSVSDYRFGNDQVPALAPGQYSDESISVDISTVTTYPTLPCGTHTYYVGFIIDYTNRVPEDNEANFWGWTGPITFPRCGSGQPNLTSEGQPYTYNFNCPSLSLSIRIINDGDGDAGPSTVGYYLSSDATMTKSDCKIGQDDVASLSPGAYSNESITISNICAVSCVSPGTYYAGYLIDEDNDVAESNENDNSWAFLPQANTSCCDQGGCEVEVTSPDGGEVWDEGSTHAITWDRSGDCDNVFISYSLDDGTTFIRITDSTPNDGYYNWTLPSVSSDQTQCRVKVQCNDGDCADWSNIFTIRDTDPQPCSIIVTDPNGGQVLDERSQYTIKWIRNGSCDNVKIEYSTNNGASWNTISNSVTNDGTHTWTLPSVSSDLTECKVRVTCTNGVCSDVSDGVFTIRNIDTQCSLTVTSPNGGEVWGEQTQHTITWNESGNCSSVRIDYTLNNGMSTNNITPATDNDGSYNWTLPSVTSDQTQCKIIITCTDGSCSDESNSNFTIRNISTSCPLKVLVPNCRVYWIEGRQYKISWIPANKSGKVKLEYLYKSSWNTIINSTDDDGCYCWDIPMAMTADIRFNESLVRITDVSDPSCTDQSDVNFLISNIAAPFTPYLMITDLMGTTGNDLVCEIKLGNNTTPIDAFSFQLAYNTSHLQFIKTEKTGLTSNWGYALSNEPTPGLIIMNGAEIQNVIPAGSNGTLFKVYFKVKCNSCDDCSQSHLHLDELKGDFTGINAYCGTYSYKGCCVCGDINMDGEINAADAVCALWINLSQQTVPDHKPECNTECALNAGDVNNDGEVLADDAVEILWYELLGGNWHPGMCGTSALSKPQLRNYHLNLHDVNARPGEVVTVPINVENPSDIDAFSLQLSYPAHLLEYTGVSKTAVTKEWTALAGNEAEAGIITVCGFHIDPIDITEQSPIAELKFVVKQDAKGEGELSIINPKCDLFTANYATASVNTNIIQAAPSSYLLSQNYPNPFNMETEIVYQLPEAGNVKLIIYNVSGQKIRTLVDAHKDAGSHNITWDGKNDFGTIMASGIYVYKLECKNNILNRKMILMK